MNKQIEEMAKDLAIARGCPCGIKPCKECFNLGTCFYMEIAVILVAEGYHKQSVGENISQMHPSDEFICEKCGLIIRDCCRYEIDEDNGDETCFEFPYRFCPRCGMKVKDGEEK